MRWTCVMVLCLRNLLFFALPLMLSGILQLLFNAADIIVVGRFSGSEALAAVGSTSSLINLLVNLFIGISIGGNVLMARYIGAQDYKNARETLHTAVCISLYGGILMIFCRCSTCQTFVGNDGNTCRCY